MQVPKPFSPESAGTWGMTTSHVSMVTRLKPSRRAASTSGAAPWLNQSVRIRRMSCRLSPWWDCPAEHPSNSQLSGSPITQPPIALWGSHPHRDVVSAVTLFDVTVESFVLP